MLKRRTTIFLSAVLLFGAAAGISWNRGTEAAAAESVSLGAETAELFLPESYEQYLPLENPVDIALSEHWIAIAEGDHLYVLDRTAETPRYVIYSHKYNISKLQFWQGRLFFCDLDLGLYELNLTDPSNLTTTTETKIVSLSTFCIGGDTLFTASVSDGKTNFSFLPLSALEQAEQTKIVFATTDYSSTPQLVFEDGALYTVVEKTATKYELNDLGTYKDTTSFTLSSSVEGLRSATSVDGSLYYTRSSDSEEDGLYVYDLSAGRSGTSERVEAARGTGYSAITSYGGMLYVLKGNAVRELDLSADDGPAFTEYEISAASDAYHRLNGAKDIARAGNLLVTANSGSNRLLVHNIADGSHRVVPCTDEEGFPYSPTLVATDGTIVAAASENRIFVYTSDWSGAWNLLETHTLEGQDAVKGIACVYGKVYYASSHHRGVVGGAELLNANTPVGLSADLYGDLYIAYIDNSVCRFTEHDFLLAGTDGERQTYTLPSGYSSVRADFEGNLYCLGEDGAVYKNGEPFCTVDGKDFVYRKESTMPSSFALGFEDDEVYFCFGDFIVRSEGGALGFPSLGTISAAGVTEQLAEVKPKEDVRLLDVGEGTIGIRVDLDTLGEDTEYFPFHSYARTDADARGVLLDETEKYLLVALYENKAYTVELFRADRCTEAEPIWTDAEGTLYLAGETALYRFPCLTAAKSESPLPRGTSVKVLSVLRPDGEDGADRGLEFAYVECETNARASVRGYVPLSLLTDADPNGVPDETYFFGTLKEDVVFRGGDGSEHTVEKGTQVKLYENADGTYTAQLQSEDETLLATVEAGMIARGESDALRIALIVILTVVAVGIIGAYIFLLPWRKK